MWPDRLQGKWPDRSQLLDEIISIPMLLSLEINIIDSIAAASTVHISRAEKDRGLQSRREENDARALIMRESKENRNQMWTRKAAEDARVCSLKPYILCSNAACIREFTCQAWADQHTMCGTHQSNGNVLLQSSNPIPPTKYDNQSVTEMAVESMLMRISSVEENRPVGHYVGSGTTNHDHK